MAGKLQTIKGCILNLFASTASLPSGLRNAFNFACAGCLQLAEAIPNRLFGILVALPLELGLQPLPLIRVHRFEIGVGELAVGSRLGREQRRVGALNAWFGNRLWFGVNPPARRQANRGCPDLPLNPLEIAVNCTEVTASRIARAAAQCQDDN
jgi:hypothetical protein